MKRFTLAASVVALGVGLLAMPGPAAASQSCDRAAVGRYYRFSRIHATHVECSLARRLAKQSIRDSNQISRRDYAYNWHRFRCSGYITNPQQFTPTKLRWRCHRDQGRQRVRFREFILD